MSPEPNLPVSSTDPTSAATAQPPKKTQVRDDGTPATTSGSGDTLLAALRQTLQRMGVDLSGIETGGSTIADTGGASQGSAGGGAQQVQSATAKSASQRFLVALYQALLFQHAINPPVQQGAATLSSDALTAAYHDLGSSIGQLAATARATLPAGTSPSGDDWDWEFADAAPANLSSQTLGTVTSNGSGDSTMESTVNALDDALQAYVASAVERTRTSVPLADVLDGLSRETKGVKWHPVGLVVDVSI
jgi:hypothetical protein